MPLKITAVSDKKVTATLLTGKSDVDILIKPDDFSTPVAVGDIFLCQIRQINARLYQAVPIKKIESSVASFVAVLSGKYLVPTDKRIKKSFSAFKLSTLNQGDIVLMRPPALGRPESRPEILKVLGNIACPFASTEISINEHHLETDFSAESVNQTQNLSPPCIDKHRKDLQHIRFVTIDGADAKDFDDAVFAEKTPDGFHVMVAIADVAWYVRPESPLDRDALKRGNSTYFPDRVLPMLPFELSAGVCSLQPNQPRGALVCELWLDNNGHKKKYRFMRALIRSGARLTYEQVQDVIEKKSCIKGLEKEIDDLIAVYFVLKTLRKKRGTLELEVPEKQIQLDKNGHIRSIKTRIQNDSHRLIEELMILANVAAAETISEKNGEAMYRVHARPLGEKIHLLNLYLQSLGINHSLNENSVSADFNDILQKLRNPVHKNAVNELILRTQSKAEYSPKNIGHYGLVLEKYAHFTSPIRRYADLLVHRALITVLQLGDGGFSKKSARDFKEIAQHISTTERVSFTAETEAVDRYIAEFLQNRVGSIFDAHISGVTNFGLYVQLEEFGADGFIPMKELTADYFEFDSLSVSLIGRTTGISYSMGQPVRVRLKESDAITGSMIFTIANQPIKKKAVMRRKYRRR